MPNSREVKGDGNCLFRCFSFYLYGNEENHLQVRAQIVSHIYNNWETYSNFIVGNTSYHINFDHMSILQERTEYYRYMSQNKIWGADAECTAFSELHPHVFFEIYKNCRSFIKFGCDHNNDNRLILNLSGPDDNGHYNIFDWSKSTTFYQSGNDVIENTNGNENVKNIIRDGNSLFICFSYFLYNHPNGHMRVRSQIVKFIKQNREKYKHLVECNKTFISLMKKSESHCLKNQYINYLSKKNNFGSKLEIKSFADKFLIFVKVYE